MSGITAEGVDLGQQTIGWLYNEALANGTDMFGSGAMVRDYSNWEQSPSSNYPQAIIDGLALAMKILSEKRAAMNGKVEAKAAPAEEPKEVQAEPAAEAVEDSAPAAPPVEEVAAAQEGGEQ